MLRALQAGFAAIRRAPLVQAVAVGTVAVSLLLVGLTRLAAINVDVLADSWGRDVEVIVYLEDGVTPVRVRKISDAVSKLPGVSGVRLIDGKEAYARLRRSLGDRGALLDGIEESLLPASLEVTLRDGIKGAVRLQPELERLRRVPGVEEVERMGDWVDRLLAAARLLRLGGLVLAALVGMACLYVVSSTIRLGVFARREEIEILKLVGATDGFVKAPFLVEGAVQGTVGALLANAMLYGVFRVAAPEIQSALGTALLASPLRFLGPGELLLTVLIGGALGIVGSDLAVSQHVRGV
jgi:cell division transport system permease protein